jgi:Sulfatase
VVVAIARLAAALLILNASLTFQSLWPTPAVRWTGELSIELAAGLLIAIAATLVGASPTSRRAIRWLTIVWLVFVLGRYGDVMAQALYGRDINLYWDLRFIPDVASMLARAAPWWLIAAAVGGTALVIALLYVVISWSVARVVDAIQAPAARGVLAAAAIAIVALFAVEYPQNLDAHERWFPTPITTQYFRQARLTVDALRGGRSVPASPPMNSDFSRVQGADVILLFIESYGAVTFDRPDFAAPLEDARRTLDDAIHATGRNSVSAFVESPTFGGESWLAHISLMSGVEVRDPHTNAVLMTQHRETVVNAFSRHGYRTIANMPGLWWDWPEGSFYGFEDIYGALRLDYRGPQFGWFTLTDQFALARIDALEIAQQPRKPLFVFFPTVSTHAPFTPTPPYQADWARMFDERPYDPADLDRSFQQVADWLDLGPGYVKAVDYTLRSVAGYLRLRADRDLVMIVIGDHQPAAAVSGERASWDVPVHVIASRPELLASLRAQGFADGLAPKRPILGKMHELLPILLRAFGEPE